jgi:hypothetical protein
VSTAGGWGFPFIPAFFSQSAALCVGSMATLLWLMKEFGDLMSAVGLLPDAVFLLAKCATGMLLRLPPLGRPDLMGSINALLSLPPWKYLSAQSMLSLSASSSHHVFLCTPL